MQGRIINIDIQGYRSVKNVSLRLNPMNVLIGANGVGKTNFISFLRAAAAHIACGGCDDNGAKSACIIKFEYEGREYIYSFKLGDGSGLVHNSRECVDAFEKFSEGWAFYQLHNTSSNADIKGYAHADNYASLYSDAGNLASVLNHIKDQNPKEYLHITEAVRSIVPYFEDFAFEREQDNIMLKWKEYGTAELFNASQMSDGTLRAIALVTLLLLPNIPQLVCIDEPELGLHPYAVGIMADLIKMASERTQIIISTQSVELVNHFEMEDVVVVERRDGESLFRRLDAEEYSHWLSDYTLGELWKSNIIGGKPSK